MKRRVRGMVVFAILAMVVIATTGAATAGSQRTAADYCTVSGHRIAISRNRKNFLCAKSYFQGSSMTLRGSYKRYGVSNRVIDSEDEDGYSDYLPDDPILTLKVSKNGRGVVYTDNLIALGDSKFNEAHGTFNASVYSYELCRFGSGTYSWRVTMDDPETPSGGQVSVFQASAMRVTC